MDSMFNDVYSVQTYIHVVQHMTPCLICSGTEGVEAEQNLVAEHVRELQIEFPAILYCTNKAAMLWAISDVH